MNAIARCLTGFEFRELFINQLLWTNEAGTYEIETTDRQYVLQCVAEMKGLVFATCEPVEGTQFPDRAERKRIERKLAQHHHEHVIVFIDRERTKQIWQVPKREQGKPTVTYETAYQKGKAVEFLARRIARLEFTLDESEDATLVGTSEKVKESLWAEKVTKKFFKEFSEHRKMFVTFLDWIDDESKRGWYCSVLLNRLMFIYFLGGKGLLPSGTGYLREMLTRNSRENGPDTFYTHFLLPLSFFGLGEMAGQRGRFEEAFKDVLYLDGGLFTVHEVERELGIDKGAVENGTFPPDASIPDSEFKRWLDYFDGWRWTLDEDKLENDGYISPHVLGYIFEKYINQKQMGAYYTKEDITGYICRNTIIPRLFDMLAESGDKGSKAVHPLPIGPHPNLLNDGRGISDGEGIDRYIYESVKRNEKLPTETDYEQDQRFTRYLGILDDFDADKIQSIDDFITYNLDIELLALDFVNNIQNAEVLHDFYFGALRSVTVLDPTCGSGAFLFAALNILYPLYESALKRMRYLVGKATGLEPQVANWKGESHFDDLDEDAGTWRVAEIEANERVIEAMRAEVERINDHPSPEYYIKKSIIVNNLYGVDIMEEAVEICKLRLFLTLIASSDRDDSKPNYGIEPLPDIDFNILAGNTLVGYASIADIDRLWKEVEHGEGSFAFEKDHSKLKFLVEQYGKILEDWRLQQLGQGKGVPITKEQVLSAVEKIRPILNEDLWRLYRTEGLATKSVRRANGEQDSEFLTLREFEKSHQPFHWLLEFPSIEASGGFDAVVGNPPYLDLSSVLAAYDIVGYRTEDAKDIYAPIFERGLGLISGRSRLGLIVRLSSMASGRLSSLRAILVDEHRRCWASSYSASDQPASLFNGVRDRLSIWLLGGRGLGTICSSTAFLKWFSEERNVLFGAKIEYSDRVPRNTAPWPKIGGGPALSVLAKLAPRTPLGVHLTQAGGYVLYYHESPVHWHKAWLAAPYYWQEARGASESVSLRTVRFAEQWQLGFAHCFANSSLFYWFFNLLSDCRHLTRSFLELAPVGMERASNRTKSSLEQLSAELSASYEANKSRYRRVSKKTGRSEFDAYYPKLSKEILDRIDKVLADHFEFSGDELSYIINYDLKYRMGSVEDQFAD